MIPVVFDLGGVLVDWDPRYLYRTLFSDEAEMERFLATVCTQAWNERMDEGLPFAEAVAELGAKHPQERARIEAFDDQWHLMLRGPIEGTVALLARLKQAGVPIYALSNWSAEKFPIARRRFDFLSWFRGIVISGEVGVKKPDPRIFRILCDRYALVPADTLFVDDVEANVEAARSLGFRAIHFTNPAQLEEALVEAGVEVL